jgi:hypothetical protein
LSRFHLLGDDDSGVLRTPPVFDVLGTEASRSIYIPSGLHGVWHVILDHLCFDAPSFADRIMLALRDAGNVRYAQPRAGEHT